MSDQTVIDINCDVGESFGRWNLGDDVAIMPHITSVSIACGFHAGDPSTMRTTVRHAVDHGLQIGAHVAFPDLLGFGRRRMFVSPDELRDYCLYQIGALEAFVEAAGGRLGHVKPHGALYVMASESPELAGAVAAAVAEVDKELPLLLLNLDTADTVAGQGVRLVAEAFVDLGYDRDGKLVLERVKLATDPELAASRAVSIARQHKVESVDGTELHIDADTICVHGDAPNAVSVARRVKQRLEDSGVAVRPLREVLAAA
jgi:5-oxoprolinase (ATP-hydrolysing) subunit A